MKQKFSKVLPFLMLLFLVVLLPVKANAADKKEINTDNCTFKLSDTAYICDGKSHKPNVKVTYNGTVLTKNKDFKLSYNKPKGPGKVKVGITGIGDYEGKVIKYYKIQKEQTLKVGSTTYTKYLDNGSFTLTPTTDGDGKITYKSKDTSVATVSSAGKVTFKKAGTVKIVVTAAETDSCFKASKTVTITIKKATKASISEEKAKAAVAWAKKIAADNSFHYGVKSSKGGWANHHGCYYCGTNGKSSAKYKEAIKKGYDESVIDQISKSYCCNPFVTAAYCHGAATVKSGNDITKYVSCKSKRINLAGDKSSACYNTTAFKKITKPDHVTDLKVGDILITSSHAMIYAGNNQIVEATSGDDGVVNSKIWNNSIRVSTLKDSSYWWGKISEIYRYIGG